MSRTPDDGMEHDAIHGTGKMLAVDQSEKVLADTPDPKSSTAARTSQPPSYLTRDDDKEVHSGPVRRGKWLLIAICIVAMLIIIALAAGLGTELADCRSSSSHSSNTNASSSTPDLSNFTVTSPTQISALNNPYCPSKDNSVLNPTGSNTDYTISCNKQLIASGPLVNIISFVSYTLPDCTQACANINAYWGWSYCQGVSWAENMENVVGQESNKMSNCFLFNGTGPLEKANGWTGATLV